MCTCICVFVCQYACWYVWMYVVCQSVHACNNTYGCHPGKHKYVHTPLYVDNNNSLALNKAWHSTYNHLFLACYQYGIMTNHARASMCILSSQNTQVTENHSKDVVVKSNWEYMVATTQEFHIRSFGNACLGWLSMRVRCLVCGFMISWQFYECG